MKILWVPGHYFLGENERSEEEARRGGRSELSREESVNLSLQVSRWSEDIILRRADSVARRMRQRSTCGFGARPYRRRD